MQAFEIPEWAITALRRYHVRNISLEEFKEIHSDGMLNLLTTPLIVLGKVAGHDAQIFVVQLFAYSKSFLQGPHLLTIYDPKTKLPAFAQPIWVNSLTCLRRRFLQIEDRLSFERAAFILLPAKERVVRLKTIRAFVTLPRQDILRLTPIYLQQDTFYLYGKDFAAFRKATASRDHKRKREDEVQEGSSTSSETYIARQRVTKQMLHCLLTLVTTYIREHPEDYVEAVQDFAHDMQKALRDILKWTSEAHHDSRPLHSLFNPEIFQISLPEPPPQTAETTWEDGDNPGEQMVSSPTVGLYSPQFSVWNSDLLPQSALESDFEPEPELRF